MKSAKILFFLGVALFLVFRIYEVSQVPPPVTFQIEKPALPEPIVIKAHPWLQIQPAVIGASLEMMRDMERIAHLSASIGEVSEEAITHLLMEKLLAYQTKIPFNFPKNLYNVLCINETASQIPAAFHTYQRLYLGETELGLPFYLEVRVFENKDMESEDLIAWHLDILKGERQEIYSSDNRKAFICSGIRNSDRPDTTHGFGTLQGKRGLYLDFYKKEGHLFVCYAEAPLSTFCAYESLLRSLNPS